MESLIFWIDYSEDAGRTGGRDVHFDDYVCKGNTGLVFGALPLHSAITRLSGVLVLHGIQRSSSIYCIIIGKETVRIVFHPFTPLLFTARLSPDLRRKCHVAQALSSYFFRALSRKRADARAVVAGQGEG
jgi:hypothetical protein